MTAVPTRKPGVHKNKRLAQRLASMDDNSRKQLLQMHQALRKAIA